MTDNNMPLYHKIQSVFKRDPDNNFKTFLPGEWAEESFEYLQNNIWVATEKVDGTNVRIHIHDDEVHPMSYTVGGRTEKAQLHADLESHLDIVGSRAAQTDLGGLTLYGEGYGPGIQKGGGDYREDKGFILFDVLAVESNMWLNRDDVEDIANQLHIPFAPVVWSGTLNAAIKKVASWDLPGVMKSRLKFGIMEGYVLRPVVELRDRRGRRVITKLKTKDFPK